MSARDSNVECPVCGTHMKKPWPEGDWPNWKCRNCDLEVPGTLMIDGE